jgi:hypothetical protein
VKHDKALRLLLEFVEREERAAFSSFKDMTNPRGDWRLDWRAEDREGYELAQRANALLDRESPRRRPR